MYQKYHNYHQKFKTLHNHSLLNLNSIKTQKKTTSLNNFIPYTNHSSSPTQIFYHNHHITYYTLYTTIQHKTYSKISTLKKTSKNIKNNKTTLNLQKQLNNLINNLHKKISQKKNYLINLTLTKKKIKINTTNLINNTIKHLKTLKTSFKNKIKNKIKILSTNFNNKIYKLKNLLSKIIHQKHILNISISQKSNKKYLIKKKNILKIKKKIKIKSNKIPPNSQFKTFHFTINHNLQNLTSKITTFQNISLSQNNIKNKQIKLLKKKKLYTNIYNTIFNQNNILIS